MQIQQIKNLKEIANINNTKLINNQGASKEEEIHLRLQNFMMSPA